MQRSFCISALAISVLACSSSESTSTPPRTTPQVQHDAGAPSDAATPPEPTVGKPIAKGVWAIDGLPLTLPDADLAPISTLVQGAEIVGIGENWHTSGDQHATRNRIVRYLVEHEGYRLVMLETPWLFATSSTDYVSGKSSDRGAAAHAMFGVFSSTYMIELFDWLRAWNTAHPNDTVQYFGFDIQESAQLAAALRAFMGRVDAARKDELTSALSACYCGAYDTLYACAQTPENDLTGAAFPRDRDTTCHAGIDKLEAEVIKNEAAYTAASSATTVARAKLGIKNLRAQQKSIATADFGESSSARDRGMHDAALGLRDIHAKSGKTILMAHDAHLEHTSESPYLKANGYPNRPCMGGMLRTTLGTKYRAIGQVAYVTKINWDGIAAPKPNTRDDSLERLLHEKGLPYMLLDLANNEFVKTGATYSYDPQGPFTTFVPSDAFDGLMFLDTSAAMVHAP